MYSVYSEIARIAPSDLDVLTPDLDSATVDDLAFRLTGLSGYVLELECMRLASAMLDDMKDHGRSMGRLEHMVVLALLRAAIEKVAWTQVGRA